MELEELRRRLEEAEDTIEAIRSGGVDALVVNQDDEQQIYTLKSADYIYRMLIESMNEGALTLSADATILYSNRRFSDMVGVASNRILGEKLELFVIPKDKRKLHSLIQKGKTTSAKTELRIKDQLGSELDVMLSVAPLTFEAEQTISVIVADLTEQKRTSALEAYSGRIADERQRIQEILFQAPAVIAVVRGPNHIFELANAQYMKLVAGKRDIIGKSVAEALPEVVEQGFIKLLDDVYRTGKAFIGNEVLIKLDRYGTGELDEAYLNFVYQPLRDERGAVNGILAHAVEVTEQVLAKQSLESSEQQFRTLANNLPVLAWMAEKDGSIFWYNSRWYDYTGTKEADMLGWGWQSVHDTEALPMVLEQWRGAIDKGEPVEMTFPLKGADGTFRPFLTRIEPIRDSTGTIVRWFGTNTDITKQKDLERQKDEFLGIASHELRTPVTSIKAYTQLLQRQFTKQGDAKTAAKLAKMDTQLDKLTNLIGDLLDVTKIESGQLQFNESTFDFDELVSESVETIQIMSEHHNIAIEGATKKMIIGDRERIGQVFINLLSNAIKYSPHTHKITVRLSAKASAVQAYVQDFGVGIPQEKQLQVFERFFRISGPHTESFPGLGLGLYISAQIVERLGGKIWVESDGINGSTFCLELPLKARQTSSNKTAKGDKTHG